MPRISSKHFENFGDGLLTICEADERSLTRTKLEHIRFGNRTVGVTRYWQAQTAGNQVDKLLAVPLEILDAEQIEVNDVIILENETDWLWDNMTFDESEMKDRAGHYQIKQVQRHETTGAVPVTGKTGAPIQRREGFWWRLKLEIWPRLS